MKYHQILATVAAAGYPPLNEPYITYSLDQGNVRWNVRISNIKKRFKSLEVAKIFRDGLLSNGYTPEPVFINPQPKNRNIVERKYYRKEYTGQDIILGPPVVVRWD
jgi:hypothetical protein